MITLYKADARGVVRIWKIHIIREHNRLEILHGIYGGSMQQQSESVEENLSGRSIEEQLVLRRNSRVNKQLDKGYRYSPQEARDFTNQNALNLPKPMLAQQFTKHFTELPSEAFLQHKYNGHRCLIGKTEAGAVFAYSRNGKYILSINHILAELGCRLLPGVILDGELYIHGRKLQELTSLIKCTQTDSNLLEFVCYDVMLDKGYSERHEFIKSRYDDLNYTKVARTFFADGRSVKQLLDLSIRAGYEGLVVRLGGEGYAAGTRSRSLLKLKQCFDGEFLVIGVEQSKDGWAILKCLAQSGAVFKTSAPGTMEQKHEVWANRDKYLNRVITVEFFELTKDGVPFHPRATHWHEEL